MKVLIDIYPNTFTHPLLQFSLELELETILAPTNPPTKAPESIPRILGVGVFGSLQAKVVRNRPSSSSPYGTCRGSLTDNSKVAKAQAL